MTLVTTVWDKQSDPHIKEKERFLWRRASVPHVTTDTRSAEESADRLLADRFLADRFSADRTLAVL